jgi:hypothetical protein
MLLKTKVKSPHLRHQKYLRVFSSLPDKIVLLKTITRFINDKAISHLDPDDLQLFQNLVFDTGCGPVNISFYSQVKKKYTRSKTCFIPSAKVLARFADFTGQISSLFVDDLFLHLLRNTNNSFIKSVFDKLSAVNKLKMMHLADTYPEIIKRIPKIKLYLTFS